MIEKLNKWHIIVILTLTIGIYSVSLSNDFIYDDTFTIKGNMFIRDWGNFPDLFSKTFFSRSHEESYRPIVTLTYFLDYSVWRLNPSGYHLTNILIHSANIVLLYLFLLSLSLDRKIAFFSALLFAVHPVQAEAVNAISFREDLLVVFFLLPAFLLFLKIYTNSGIGWIKRLALYLLSLLLYLLALLSKEMAVVFPLFLIGYYFCFTEQKQERNLFISLFIGYAAITIGYLFLYFGPFNNPNPTAISTLGFFIRILTLPKILVSYLLLILFPWELNADYVIKFSSSLFEFSVLFPIFILSGAGVAFFVLAIKRRKEVFGLWWFFAGLLPVMNIIPIYNVMAERYLYMPFVGISLFFSTGLIYLFRWAANKDSLKLWIRVVVTLGVITLMSRTVLRNMDWKNDFSLWSKTVVTSPESDKAHNNLGIAYVKQGLLDKAMTEYGKALEINPYHIRARNNLGVVYVKQGLLEKALAEYKAALEIDPYHAEAHNNIGDVYNKKGLLNLAMVAFKEAIRINPDFAHAHYNLGAVYDIRGLLNNAITEYKKALKINPDFRLAKDNLERAMHLEKLR